MPANRRIDRHPVLDMPPEDFISFTYDNQPFQARRGEMISSALFAGGVKIFGHHYLDDSPQGIFCANGQCSQCMVIADGRAVKACMEPVTEGMAVFPLEGLPELASCDEVVTDYSPTEVLKCDVLVIGGGPAGIAGAVELGQRGHSVILVDDKDRLGGKLILQTHKFFGSIEDCYAGTRGVEIAKILTQQVVNEKNIRVMLEASAVGVFVDKKVGILQKGRYFLVEPKKLLVAAGAREKALTFPGCDLPGVYGAGAFQTLLNRDLVRPSHRLFVIGGGNVGVIAAYHALQAGITVTGLAEALPSISGYKVHGDKLVRLGTPIYTSHSVVRADGDEEGVTSVTIAQVDENFRHIPGTHKRFLVDTVLIAVGLTPVDEMFNRALEVGMDAFAAGDAKEIAEASAALFSGRITGLEIARALGDDVKIPGEWTHKMEILKSRPGKLIEAKNIHPDEGVFPVFHCAQEIPCNPCTDVCPQNGITIPGDSLMGLPQFEGVCTGCNRCVAICPGLAVTLVDYRKAPPGYAIVTVPLELLPDRFSPASMIPALDRDGNHLGDVKIHKLTAPKFARRTLHLQLEVPREIARSVAGVALLSSHQVGPVTDEESPGQDEKDELVTVCRCMRVTDGEIRTLIRQGVRDMNQLKAQLNLGMGACGGRTCRQLTAKIFREEGIPDNEVTPLTYRSPDVEVPLGVFAGVEE